VIRRYGHVFLLWKIPIQLLILEFIEKNSCLLIEIELRRLHRRFDHSSTRRLHEILHCENTGYVDVLIDGKIVLYHLSKGLWVLLVYIG
jgi:hypothetical protein